MLRLLQTKEEKNAGSSSPENGGRRRSRRAVKKVSYSEKDADKEFRERLRESNAAAKAAKKQKSKS